MIFDFKKLKRYALTLVFIMALLVGAGSLASAQPGLNWWGNRGDRDDDRHDRKRDRHDRDWDDDDRHDRKRDRRDRDRDDDRHDRRH